MADAEKLGKTSKEPIAMPMEDAPKKEGQQTEKEMNASTVMRGFTSKPA